MALNFEEQTRIDLAATFRIIAHLGMHEAVANHFSAAISADGKQFCSTRSGNIFHAYVPAICCCSTPMMPTRRIAPMSMRRHGPFTARSTSVCPMRAWCCTCTRSTPQPWRAWPSRIFRPSIRTLRYFNRIAVDELYGGMADTTAEGARLAGLLEDKSRLLMGNHGVIVTAPTVGEAFDDIWTLERACQILVTAWSTGQPLKVLADDVAEKTARDWQKITDFSRQHFEEMKLLMIQADPSLVD